MCIPMQPVKNEMQNSDTNKQSCYELCIKKLTELEFIGSDVPRMKIPNPGANSSQVKVIRPETYKKIKA